MDEKYGRAKQFVLSDLARQRGEGNLHQSFSHKILEKKMLLNIYVILSFQFKIIYMSTSVPLSRFVLFQALFVCR